MSLQLPDLPSFSLQVTVYFKPEDVPKFYEAMKPVFEKVTAEPECLYFEMFEDPSEPGKISWIENWAKSPHWVLTVPTRLDLDILIVF